MSSNCIRWIKHFINETCRLQEYRNSEKYTPCGWVWVVRWLCVDNDVRWWCNFVPMYGCNVADYAMTDQPKRSHCRLKQGKCFPWYGSFTNPNPMLTLIILTYFGYHSTEIFRFLRMFLLISCLWSTLDTTRCLLIQGTRQQTQTDSKQTHGRGMFVPENDVE